MNNTITLSQLITSLAKTASTDTNTSRRFVRAFFATIQEAVAAGQTVSIKGFGTFRPNPEAAMGNTEPLVFIPDPELADKANAPFAMFGPIELADDVNFDLEIPETKTEPEPVVVPQPEPIVIPEPEPVVVPQPEPIVIPEPEPVVAPAPAPTPAVEPRIVIPLGAADDEEDEEEDTLLPPAPKKNTPWWLIAIIAIVIAGVGGYLAAEYTFDDTNNSASQLEEMPVEDIQNPEIEEIDVNDVSVAVSAMDAEVTSGTQPASEPAQVSTPTVTTTSTTEPAATPTAQATKYDTVTKSRYLATMARQYYGNSSYWVFIYQANADKLKHPDRIAPGTKVRIPDKSEFAEANSNATMRKAEKLRAEIYQKFNK